MKPKVKICGLTNLIDAKNAINLGADFIGFINIQHSPRFISIEDIYSISQNLSEEERSKAVLLSDSKSQEEIIEQSLKLGFKIIQSYASLKNTEINKLRLLGYKIFKPIRINQEEDLEEITEVSDLADLIILDTKVDHCLGGSGQSFDWLLFDKAKRLTKIPLGLAGGLSPENIGEAIALTNPYLIDLSSGLESKPGIKSLEKMKSLFKNLVQTVN